MERSMMSTLAAKYRRPPWVMRLFDLDRAT